MYIENDRRIIKLVYNINITFWITKCVALGFTFMAYSLTITSILYGCYMSNKGASSSDGSHGTACSKDWIISHDKQENLTRNYYGLRQYQFLLLREWKIFTVLGILETQSIKCMQTEEEERWNKFRDVCFQCWIMQVRCKEQ